MGYIRKDIVIDALKEDMEDTKKCYEGYQEKELVEFCYNCMERVIDRLPQYYPENVVEENTREWAESEYIEKSVISKRDRAFLEYLDTIIHYVTRDLNDDLHIYISKPHKLIGCWESSGCELDKSLKFFKLDFPMVKWEDDKPWLIEDLKKLEVVEDYE